MGFQIYFDAESKSNNFLQFLLGYETLFAFGLKGLLRQIFCVFLAF